jgi:DNA helicase-2/ATP-dependent DNA helicase PcrA
MDIPYKIMGKISFLDNKIIVLIISYLRLLINEKDNISLQKIFSFSFNCISSKMKKIFDKADKSQEYYWNVINNLKPSKNDNTYILIKKFITFINSLKEQITMKEPIYFVEKIIEFIKSSFSFNEGDEDLISLFNNMAEFLTQKYHSYLRINDDDGSKENKSKDNFEGSGSFLQNNFNEDIDHNKSLFVKYSIKEFLDDIILLNTNEDIMENINNISGNEIIPNNSNKVKLMTIHSSKGLEFNSVFIVGVEEHLYPLSYYGMKDETEEKRKKHEEEERRMFYVAITRAKQNCFITYAHKRLTGKNVMIRKKSKFIGELENKYLDFSGDIINSNENFLQFKKSLINNNWNNNFNSFYNNKSYSHNNNYNKDKNKNDSFPKKSNSNSFLNKKRYNPFK